MRILFIPQDGGGLGHLRRLACLAQLAQSRGHEAVVISGHSAASLVVPAGVEHVKIEPYEQLPPRAEVPHRARDVLMAERRSSICATIDRFKPDIIACDHRPFGRYEELEPIIEHSKHVFILILRGILQDPTIAQAKFADSFSQPLFRRFSRIFVCCDREICDAAAEYPFLSATSVPIRHLGFVQHQAIDAGGSRNGQLTSPRARRWCVISNGGGKVSSQCLPAIIDALGKANPSDWEFDIVAGPYCTLPESFAPPSTLTVRIHQSVPDLWRWHQSADAVITSGGSNTVLETLRGRAKLLPVTTSRNGEIRILCERLHARGLSARPIAPESLTDFESHVTKCPKESFSLDMCTAERLDAELSAAMKKR